MPRRALDDELEYFESVLPNLLKDHRGEYALVHNKSVHAFFDTWEAAVEAGYERFGRVPFLARLVSAEPEVVHMTSLLLEP